MRALPRSSGGHGHTGEKKDHLPADNHAGSVRLPAPLHASALKEQHGDRVSLKMFYHPCVSGCDHYLALRTVTIAASRAWAFSTLRKFLWMVHVLQVGT